MQPALPLHPVHAGLWSLGRLHGDFGFGDGDGEDAVAYEVLQDPREIVPADPRHLFPHYDIQRVVVLLGEIASPLRQPL